MPKSTDFKRQLGERLRWAREQAGLSQGQVAEITGLHRPTISEIEAGRRNVKLEELKNFAITYDVNEQWLNDGTTTSFSENDPRIRLVARELAKLKREDLDAILKVLRVVQNMVLLPKSY